LIALYLLRVTLAYQSRSNPRSVTWWSTGNS